MNLWKTLTKTGWTTAQIIGLLFLLLIIFGGCAPKIVYKTQEVKIPIKCQVVIPKKPKYDGGFTSARSLSEYYLEIEDLLRICING